MYIYVHKFMYTDKQIMGALGFNEISKYLHR